jgi:hypothetical protein
MDFRYDFLCHSKGHAGNPSVREEDLDPKMRKTWFRDGYLFGTLQDFTNLQKLTIDPIALCGDKTRGPSPEHLVDLLPSSLKELNLAFAIHVTKSGSRKRVNNEELQDQIWIPELLRLVQNAATRLPNLAKVELLSTGGLFEEELDGGLFDEVKNACSKSSIWIKLKIGMAGGITPEPYFQTYLSTRRHCYGY